MDYTLATNPQNYVAQLVDSGRFHDPGEVVSDALRRMQAQEYLTPPPLDAAFESFRAVACQRARA